MAGYACSTYFGGTGVHAHAEAGYAPWPPLVKGSHIRAHASNGLLKNDHLHMVMHESGCLLAGVHQKTMKSRREHSTAQHSLTG